MTSGCLVSSIGKVAIAGTPLVQPCTLGKFNLFMYLSFVMNFVFAGFARFRGQYLMKFCKENHNFQMLSRSKPAGENLSVVDFVEGDSMSNSSITSQGRLLYLHCSS